MMFDWYSSAEHFLPNAYDFLRAQGAKVTWDRMVWEPWSMPRYNFILWLTVLGRIKTKDRLHFASINAFCVFCRQEDETHAHLFFSRAWTSSLWGEIKSWLRINRRMSIIVSAIRGLSPRGRNKEAKMRRVSLGLTIYLIWVERNKRLFDNCSVSVEMIFHKFQVMFYTIFHFYDQNHLDLQVG
jgi:hypothetical protein